MGGAEYSLEEGPNIITVEASNALGSYNMATIVVAYAPPPPVDVRDITGHKTKITIWFPESYTELDRFNLIGYMQYNPGETFEFPFYSDVHFKGWIRDPENPSQNVLIFSYTIPADTVDVLSGKYRYLRPGSENSGSGLREVIFTNRDRGDTRLYLYVNNEDFLADRKAAMGEAAFKDYLKRITHYTVDVQIEDKQ